MFRILPIRRGALASSVLILLAATSFAQTVPEMTLAGQIDGSYPNGPVSFGTALITPGDLDGDGVDDFIVTARFWNPLNLSPSEIRAVSGSDLSTIYSIAGTYSGVFIYGISLGLVGDIDLDGVQDFATVDKNFTAYTIRVAVRSGATGQPIYTSPMSLFTPDVFIEPLGDRSGDGVSEFAVSPVLGGVAIVDGATGVVRQTLTNPSPSYGSGGIRAIGDLNGDGLEDLAVFWSSFSWTASNMEILTSSGGSFVTTEVVTTTQAQVDVTKAPDLDLDGLPDYFISVVEPYFSGIPAIIEARSGATNAVLWTAPSPPPGWIYGGHEKPLTMRDLNGDGVSEVAFTLAQVPVVNNMLTQRILVHSGLDGQPLTQVTLDPVTGYSLPNGFPHSSGLGSGDFNGDGLADIVVPEPLGNAGAGYVRVYFAPSVFDPTTAQGNVMDAGGARVDVLKVGAVGGGGITAGGATRAVVFPIGADIAVHLEGAYGTPPNQSPFALFGKVLPGGSQHTFVLPFGIGAMCFAPEVFDPYGVAPLFTLLNTFGGWPALLLGSPLLFPAQSLQVASTGPIPIPVSFWLQGFLTDLSKPWPYLSVTNAIRVVVR
ncbi:MAG TPA: VCBS repeat-containing protein [Planctomycetes bacterium]|nr:VCBS repeat-containing protein [Planctomycetota bacterium]